MRPARDRASNRTAVRPTGWESAWFPVLAAIVTAYALLGSLRPVFGDDPFFMLNDARWLVEHHEIPAVDHFSFTAQGQPWIYPVGGSLLFCGLWLIGGCALLSWVRGPDDGRNHGADATSSIGDFRHVGGS